MKYVIMGAVYEDINTPLFLTTEDNIDQQWSYFAEDAMEFDSRYVASVVAQKSEFKYNYATVVSTEEAEKISNEVYRQRQD